MTTDNRTNEKIETRKCSNQACPLRRAHSGPCAPSDWKPGAPSEAQVEAAARALDPIAWGRYDLLAYAKNPWPSRDLIVEHSLSRARAALVAAAGAAPQAECDCGAGPGSAVCKRVCATRAPVQPSSTVDEAALIREAKAEAWDEGYWQGINGHTGPGNPYSDCGAVEYREGSET